MNKVLELVVFRLRDGVNLDEFLTAVDAVSEWLADRPGFVSRELYTTHDDTWIDVVYWSSLREAEDAAKLAVEAEECKPMFEAVDVASIQMHHGQPVVSRG